MSRFIKDVTTESLEAAADHSTKRGYFVKLASGKATLVTATTDVPYGCILDGEIQGGRDTVNLSGGNGGSQRVKVSTGPVTKGTKGKLAADGSVVADPGTGTRILVCRFMEDGATGELVHAMLLEPQSF